MSGKRIADIYSKQLFQPMKRQMTLSTDRKSASEGEYIEIRWTCDACPDSLYLAIDSERTQYSIAVSDSGSTRIPIPKSNGKMTVKLVGSISGKKVTESVEVRVKTAKQSKPKVPISVRMKTFGENMKAKWYVFRANMKYWWLSQKKWQKALWIALLAIWFGLLFSSFGNRPQKQTAPAEVQTAPAEVQTAYLTR